MTKDTSGSRAVAAYIAAAPAAVRPILRRIRSTVRAAAPDAAELLSYRIPSLRGKRILIHYAAFAGHIGVFPPVSGNARLEAALAPYAGPKGNLRFPLDRPIPYALLARIVRHRLEQERGGASSGKTRPKAAKAARRGSQRPSASRASPVRRPAQARGAARRRKPR
jgi:uncharacterized protein YdhG (YjbR/CyaY superfamily)